MVYIEFSKVKVEARLVALVYLVYTLRPTYGL